MDLFKDKAVRDLLLGPTSRGWPTNISRVSNITFPAREEGDKEREIKFPTADGIILYLLKRIENLEARLPKKSAPKPLQDN